MDFTIHIFVCLRNVFMPLLLFYALYNSDIVQPKLKITNTCEPIILRQAENFKAWLSLQI